VDGDGNVIVADMDNNCIRKITPKGHVSTLAGTGGMGGYRDGKGTVAQFNQTYGIAVDGDGKFIVADAGNCRIRKITRHKATCPLWRVLMSRARSRRRSSSLGSIPGTIRSRSG
jgi:hypothetical protein